MLSKMRSRGPDGTSWMALNQDGAFTWNRLEGPYINGDGLKASLGCSRLAIVDLSDKGLQPLANEKDRIWSVLNGEIYNFVELRAELEALGHCFRTATDTEVICHAYEQWGTDCFNHFNGPFGIGIYDLASYKLIIARDRLGIKPLFWYKHDSVFLFATEIKSLLSVPIVEKRVNPDKIKNVIGLPYKLHDNGENTLYANIFQVQPGSYIEIDAKVKKRSKSYWTLGINPEYTRYTFDEAKELLQSLLENAVKIRLRGDCEPSFLLSGGIDSSGIAGIAVKKYHRNIETFSLNLPDPRYNEIREIKETVRFLGAEANFIDVTSRSICELLPVLIDIFDENIPTPNGILHLLLARSIARKKYKVVFNGVGGDEAFLGYHDHFLFFLHFLKMSHHPSFSEELTKWVETQHRSPDLFKRFCRYLSTRQYMNSPDFLSRSNNYDYTRCLKSIFLKDRKDTLGVFDAPEYNIHSKQLLDITRFTLPYALKMDDRFYMSQGIETRHPFLDYRIIELGLSLNPTHKIKGAVSKYILRSVLNNYVQADRLTDARKIGLNLPIDIWMRRELKAWITGHLSDKENPIFEYADFGGVQSIVKHHMENKENHYLKLWDLVNLDQWLQRSFC